ncbi:MAG: EamA family transporter [Geobacteraceae bacterium]
MLKTIVVMLIATSAGTIGDILLTKGMKDLGDLSSMSARKLITALLRGFTDPRLVLGTALLALFFLLWIAVLSWEDLSVALPMQALNYVLVAFLSRHYLGESVTPTRWAGTILVCLGVLLITVSGTG